MIFPYIVPLQPVTNGSLEWLCTLHYMQFCQSIFGFQIQVFFAIVNLSDILFQLEKSLK
jgi:hypothetical protein